MSTGPITRRQLFALLISSALTTTLARRGLAGPLDQGIGGTGAAPPNEESDRGIGGTGVIGTIRKFGSIIVNDLRISYPQDAVVRIDGQPASLKALKIGQVVRVAASGPQDALSTGTIDVTHEVVGPIETATKKTLTVLGQTVAIDKKLASGLKVGDRVAVSGLRRPDGTIVASLVERSAAGDRVAGPVRVANNGGLEIGGLPVSGLDPRDIGRRTIVTGTSQDGRFAASQAITEASLLPGVRTLSIESYVARSGSQLSLGSGFRVVGGASAVPEGRTVRAVLSTRVAANGELSVERVRPNGPALRDGATTPGGRGGLLERHPGNQRLPISRGGSPQPKNGQVPMDFGDHRRPGSGGPLEGTGPLTPGGIGGPGDPLGGPGGPLGGVGGGPGGGPLGGIGGGPGGGGIGIGPARRR